MGLRHGLLGRSGRHGDAMVGSASRQVGGVVAHRRCRVGRGSWRGVTVTGPGTSTHLVQQEVRDGVARTLVGRGPAAGLGGGGDSHSENMFEAPGDQAGGRASRMTMGDQFGWIEFVIWTFRVVVQDTANRRAG